MYKKLLIIFLHLFRVCSPVCPGCPTEIPPPQTVQMCFVGPKMSRNSMRQDIVLLNIQIVRCECDEICYPARDSEYYGMGLGYVFF